MVGKVIKEKRTDCVREKQPRPAGVGCGVAMPFSSVAEPPGCSRMLKDLRRLMDGRVACI